MKTNYRTWKSKTANIHWHTWSETCDLCGDKIHTAEAWQSSTPPDKTKDVCLKCMRKYMDENRDDELRAILKTEQ